MTSITLSTRDKSVTADSTAGVITVTQEQKQELQESPAKSHRIWWYVAALVVIAIILIWVLAKK